MHQDSVPSPPTAMLPAAQGTTSPRRIAYDADAPLADADDRDVLRIRASFGRLARDPAASRSSCAAARECVGTMLANL